jgi:G3E family GTPase
MLCEVLGNDELDPNKAAERVFAAFSAGADEEAAGATLSSGLRVRRLKLAAGGETKFAVRIVEAGRYWLFTQHLPSEFSLQLLAADGRQLTPCAQRDFAPGHSHDERVGSFSLESTRPVNPQRFQAWLTEVLQAQGTRLYRMKGFLNFAGSNERIVIQGVHMVVDTSALGPWGDRARRTQLVFIGRDLDRDALRTGFEITLE